MDPTNEFLLERLRSDIAEFSAAAKKCFELAAQAKDSSERAGHEEQAQHYLKLIRARERQVERILNASVPSRNAPEEIVANTAL